MNRSTGFLTGSMAFLTLISLACFAFPIYVIRPFRHQGMAELAAALFVKRIAPWVSAMCAVLCIAIAVQLRSRVRRWPLRVAMLVSLLLAVLGSVMTHVDVYERMFHPLDAPAFEAAQQAKVDGDDMVIAVNLSGEARAYPIREMAYHHIVNDVVSGQPIVSTY